MFDAKNNVEKAKEMKIAKNLKTSKYITNIVKQQRAERAARLAK